MKLLLFSDLHADAEAARRLVELARDADVLVGAGDFGTVRRRIGVCIEVLKVIDKPAVLVSGNNESTEELTAACRDWPRAVVLHGTGVEIDGVPFFELRRGRAGHAFGSWSYDFTEDQARVLLADCQVGCVLVSHSPPRGAADADRSGRSLGSEAVREAVERVRPALVVCGHIHDSSGRQETLGSTPVVNAGPGGAWTLAL